MKSTSSVKRSTPVSDLSPFIWSWGVPVECRSFMLRKFNFNCFVLICQFV
jgi:hypothetical protein